MTLSICLPTYNRAERLKDALDALAAQAGDGVEICVSDNGSTDATPEVLAAAAKKFPLKWRRSDRNRGVARNILDPATHLLFSNKLEDNAPIDELRAQGLSIDEAIGELLRRRGHTV